MGSAAQNLTFEKVVKKRTKRHKHLMMRNIVPAGAVGEWPPFFIHPSIFTRFFFAFDIFMTKVKSAASRGYQKTKVPKETRLESNWIKLNHFECDENGVDIFFFSKTHNFLDNWKRGVFQWSVFLFFLFRVAVCAPRTPTRISDYEFLERRQNDRKVSFSLFEGIIDSSLVLESVNPLNAQVLQN